MTKIKNCEGVNKRRNLLSNRSFILYWISSTFAMAASNILQFVLALYVLDLTHSATTFASILSIVIVPRIIAMPISGVWADRYHKVRLMAGINIGSGVFLGLFAVLHLAVQPLSVPMVFILVVLLELSEVLYSAPSATIIPSVVSKSELAEATSLSSIDDGIVQILGSVVAAFTYNAIGLAGGLLGAVVFNLIACFTILFVHIPETLKETAEVEEQREGEVKKSGAISQFFDAVKLVRGNSFIRRLVILAPLLNFFLTSIFTVTLVYLLREKLQISTNDYAVYSVLCGVMGIVVPLLSISFMKKKSEGVIIQGSMAILTILVLSLSIVVLPSVSQALGNLFILRISIGIAVMMSTVLILMNIATTVVFKTKVRLDYIGRVASIINLFATISVPLGQLIFGYLADSQPIGISFFISAVGMFVVFLIARRMFQIEREKDE
ncbi:MAG: MFS transporter [Anaerolineaceae bacterium]